MNPIKWAKKQVAKFLGAEPTEPEAKPHRPLAKANMRTLLTAKQMAKRLMPRPLPLGAKWFFISTRKKWSYVAGKNKAKRYHRMKAEIAKRKRMWEHSPRQVSLAQWMAGA